MGPEINSLGERTGVEILDPIESNRYVFHTPEEVTPTPTDTEAFTFPVSVARQFVTSALTIPENVTAAVRDDDGSHLRDVGHEQTHELDADDYLLEVSAPIKLYVRFASALTIDATTERIRIEFDGPTAVEVGARSSHNSPADTITVPDDPEDAMEAISAFSSALKTTSPERSWPTLRGHPPRVERGDELSIPDGLDAPDTGITIRVPADYEYLYPVAPLAYYLGAEVVPGETPRLTTDEDFEHRLDTYRGFEDEVARVLKQVFALDCATRTEGFHPMDLTERRAIEAVADLDFPDLYDASPAERLAAYLSVPAPVSDDAMTLWSRVTHVRPTPESVELLPFIVNDLSLVRTKSAAPEPSPTADQQDGQDAQGAERTRQQDALSSFKRSSGFADLDLPSPPSEQTAGVPDQSEYVPLPETDAMERAWVGDGTPVHGAKLLGSAFDRDRLEPTDSVIDVIVVCNDEQMREEWDTVSEVYGTRDVVAFDVDCRFGVSTDELRDLLAEDHDLFHFIGHIDGRGFACPDGILDAETVSETGAKTILLNACRSHDQGVALVEAGARAAIVSWGDVGNLGAVEVGETFARLLNYGFGVGIALEIVEEYTSIGRHYVVVGDPSVSVAQCEDGGPRLYELDWEADAPPGPDDEVATTVTSHPSPEYSTGSVADSYLVNDEDADFHLVPGSQQFTNTGKEIESVLGDYSAPIVVGGELRWTDKWFGGDAAE
ncbi:hypothetical protein [Halorussus lipolyticus]|uniref:hypothetical protein n=1 Tax=Halorussus lipolyticus TaxID=3034024 RepID=UPI0023E85DDD|nr:hypothetical protein [Halorussus sp. DT80]